MKEIILYNDCDNTINEQALEEEYYTLKDMLNNYDTHTSDNYIIVAVLGLWYGTKKAQKKVNHLTDLLNYGEEFNKVYFANKRATLTLKATHHDGTNIFKIYRLVNGRKKAINYNDFFNNI